MRWENIKKAGSKAKVIGDVEYNLGHLQGKRYTFTFDAAHKYPKIELQLLVQYGAHCVSIGPKGEESFDFTDIGEDYRITGDKDMKN